MALADFCQVIQRVTEIFLNKELVLDSLNTTKFLSIQNKMKFPSVKTFLGSLDTRDIVLKYVLITALGAAIVFLDEHEIVDPVVNTWAVFLLAIGKNLFFTIQSLQKIRHVVNKKVAYFRFLIFMFVNILTIIFSYGVDYFCLYQISPGNFTGLPIGLTWPQLFFEFFYLSLLGFNNLGFYDVIPVSMAAKTLVMGEIMFYYFTIILILSDFVSLRDSIIDERLKKSEQTRKT